MEMSADRRADDPGVGGAASAPPAEPRDRLSHANQRMPPQPRPALRPWAWGPRSGPRGQAVLPHSPRVEGRAEGRPHVHWVFPGLCPPVLVASVPRQPAGPQVVVLGVFGPPLLRGNAPARAGEAELRGLPGCAEYIFILSEREAWEPKYKLDRTLFPTVDQWTARVTVYLL